MDALHGNKLMKQTLAPMTHPLPEAFLNAIRTDFPADFASFEPDDLREFGKDWTKVYAPAPQMIAFAKTTGEVAALVKLANAHGVAIVPSGGRTGLAAGAVAANGEVVLSLSRMKHMGEVDPLALTVRVEAGAITEAVHQHVEPHHLTWPVDFASKGSSSVGGNIATNAGGVKVIRYGLTRQWVLGLEVVTGAGDVLFLNGALEKNNTGIDLRQLFIGSEGILGIITAATLKLTRLPGKLDVFLFAVPTLEAVLALFGRARRGPFSVMAFEFFTDKCLARVERHRKVRPPFPETHPYYVLLEVEAKNAEAVEGWMMELVEDDAVSDGVLAQSGSDAAALWTLREGISESLSATGMPHKNDIALPIAELKDFCAEFGRVFEERYAGWEICLFGHIGDGNLHVNVMKPDALSKEEFLARTHEADKDMFELVRKHKGSVSAEHGIGMLKRDALHYSRTETEIELMRAMKKIFDPRGILNPGKVL